MNRNSSEGADRYESFGFLIQTLARRFNESLRQRLDSIDIEMRVFSSLEILNEADGLNQSQLGKKLDLPDYHVSRNIDIMVADGLAERRPDPNSRRSVLIYLTESGRKKASILPEILNDLNELHMQHLSKQERKEVVKLLQKSTDAFL